MSVFESKYLFTQYGLLVAQIALLAATIFFYKKLVANDNQRERRTVENEIKHWCKCVFRGVDSPGALQRAGEKVRKRFPDRMKLILAAYDELLVEEPSNDRPILYKFIETMNAVESGKWPSIMDAMTDKLDLYS